VARKREEEEQSVRPRYARGFPGGPPELLAGASEIPDAMRHDEVECIRSEGQRFHCTKDQVGSIRDRLCLDSSSGSYQHRAREI
jgi:hypothetical protein